MKREGNGGGHMQKGVGELEYMNNGVCRNPKNEVVLLHESV